ncbi:hypothetical protein BGW36DRAFT_382444 [Talaromyces proteolyticus]|uniref:2EXR domain-containing protein n=1 Tax=Talaromyces proteolyticus TaxID=1131652 RepID=A0AAD4PWN5_9EURO|nr:uncharacterized protein BGW36DRAFT_382444 [Talaromyces proteolyticus]KAH8695290.1 hypothetical protein BGW36DRAFT_382444 [Talaromyces proteolyticus]
MEFIHSLLSTWSSTAPSPTSFPQFARLPPEVRTIIWEYAMESRIIPIEWHCRRLDTPAASSEGIQDGGVNQRMAITTCTLGPKFCQCRSFPPSSPHTVALPSVFFVCRESRNVTRRHYSAHFDKYYDVHGRPLVSPSADRETTEEDGDETTPQPKIGAFINPAVDGIYLKFKVTSVSEIVNLHQFVEIMVKEAACITKIVVKPTIILRPYMWWQKERFQKWRNWGPDGHWVPPGLHRLKKLREVVVLIDGSVSSKMLPTEWRERTASIWSEELEKTRLDWPIEWEGNMPPLRFQSHL